jgi:DNA polymerase-3 subunit epsilon
MRQIVLDTETTGLNAKLGDRVIEIACVEMINRRLTGKHFHCYVNPEREIDEGALKVHGITLEFLADKPKFQDVAQSFVEYLDGAELIIHNAAFDLDFLNEELARLQLPDMGRHSSGVIDTLRMARELHPGKRNSLDALCDRYGINNAHRTLHGALLDAELLAEVFLAMTRGQDSLAIDLGQQDAAERARAPAGSTGEGLAVLDLDRGSLQVIAADAEELAAHAALLAGMEREAGGAALWLREAAAPAEVQPALQSAAQSAA